MPLQYIIGRNDTALKFSILFCPCDLSYFAWSNAQKLFSCCDQNWKGVIGKYRTLPKSDLQTYHHIKWPQFPQVLYSLELLVVQQPKCIKLQ